MRLRRLPLAALIAVLWPGAGRLAGQTAPGIRVAGRVFSELEVVPTDSAPTAQFNLTRAYLMAIATLRPGLTGHLTMDVTRDSSGPLVYRLKHAYFQWLPTGGRALDLRFGMVPTAWIEWQDGLWGYRMQGAQLIDRTGFITSADLGASAGFATSGQRLEGVVDVVNGEGYANPPDGRYVDAEARASLRLLASDDTGRAGGLRIAGFAHVGRFASGLARQRYIEQLSYRGGGGVVGASYGFVVNDDADADNADVRLWSAFGAVNLGATPLALAARLDRLETVQHALGDVFTRSFAGVACRLGPGVRVLGDVERTAYLADRSVTPGAPRTRLLFQTELVF